MLLSYNWLTEYYKPSKTPQKLAEILPMTTAEVDGIHKLGEEIKDVIVGEVLEVKPHPNADKLKLTKVKIGRDKVLKIICGAPNVKTGQKVAVAIIGATLSDDFKIKKIKIRGVESNGMICSEKELKISDEANGIMILDQDAKIGQDIKKILGLNDTLLELDITANRIDLLGMDGIAREIATVLNTPYEVTRIKSLPKIKKSTKPISIKVKTPRGKASKDLCPRYLGVAFDNIKIKPSPIWLQNKLRNLGSNPINNIVDITNYIMLKTGQPLHAFDYDKLKSKMKSGKEIIIRTADKNEKLKALDDKTYSLDKETLVIADSKRPIAIAGVVGGANTTVDQNTKTIILETANFDQQSINKTSKRLGIRTESSAMFEKGLDPENILNAFNQARKLIEEISGGMIASKPWDIKNYQKKTRRIKTDIKYLEKLLGVSIEYNEFKKILENLGFRVKNLSSRMRGSGKKIDVFVPSFRPDITTQTCLAEEFIRIKGYDQVPLTPMQAVLTTAKPNKKTRVIQKTKTILTALGFMEIESYPLVGEKLMQKVGIDVSKLLELKNYLGPDRQYLLNELYPNLLEKTAENSKNFEEFSLFEINPIFPKENLKLTFLNVAPKETFFKTKGQLKELLDQLGIKRFKLEPLKSSNIFDPTAAAAITVDQKSIGSIGQVSKNVLENFKIKHEICLIDIDFEKLLELTDLAIHYKPYSSFPKIIRDISVVISPKVSWKIIKSKINGVKSKLIQDVEVFDVYAGQNLKGNKSIAFRIIYQAMDKTLTAKEVERVHQKVLKNVGKIEGLTIRK